MMIGFMAGDIVSPVWLPDPERIDEMQIEFIAVYT